jgi:hypothetical protein
LCSGIGRIDFGRTLQQRQRSSRVAVLQGQQSEQMQSLEASRLTFNDVAVMRRGEIELSLPVMQLPLLQ